MYLIPPGGECLRTPLVPTSKQHRSDIDHSYDEIRGVVLDLLAELEEASYLLDQYQSLLLSTASVFLQREKGGIQGVVRGAPKLSVADEEKFDDVFQGLLSKNIIVCGCDENNRNLPFFRISRYGRGLFDKGTDQVEKALALPGPKYEIHIQSAQGVFVGDRDQTIRSGK